MVSASSVLSEEHFLCSICMDVFTDPVVTPCGHNYCKTCITQYWDTNDVCQCPLCGSIFCKRPEVSVNSLVAEMVHQLRSQKVKVEYEAKTEDEVQQMIQERQEKIQEVKHSVELSKKDKDAVIRAIFSALISCIERSQAELIDVIEEKQKTTERQAEGFIKDLQMEITLLEKRISELKQQLSHTEDHILQNVTSINAPPPTKDSTKVNVHQSYVGTVRGAVAQLEKTLSEEMEKNMYNVELRMIQQYAVNVTLDPDTANPYLFLSADRKQVSDGDKWKNLPENKERFSECVCVLGKQSLSSGRFYYEVQVKGKTEWDLGVVRESINRKDFKLNPDSGYWTILLRNGNKYMAAAGPSVLLPVREKVQKVGVFVDYEEGLVSFYDVEARVHLYSFTGCTFTEKLYPYFSPCFNDGGTNSAPLIISPVNMDADLYGEGGNVSPPTSKRRRT